MSLYLYGIEGDFLLPVEDLPDALLALQAAERERVSAPTPSQRRHSDEPNAVLRATTLPEALETHHLNATLDASGNLVGFTSGCGNFHGERDYSAIFAAIAPFVRSGSWVSMQVEDASLTTHAHIEYRWDFAPGGVTLTIDPPKPWGTRKGGTY